MVCLHTAASHDTQFMYKCACSVSKNVFAYTAQATKRGSTFESMARMYISKAAAMYDAFVMHAFHKASRLLAMKTKLPLVSVDTTSHNNSHHMTVLSQPMLRQC